jgi:hypothetical protein
VAGWRVWNGQVLVQCRRVTCTLDRKPIWAEVAPKRTYSWDAICLRIAVGHRLHGQRWTQVICLRAAVEAGEFLEDEPHEEEETGLFYLTNLVCFVCVPA